MAESEIQHLAQEIVEFRDERDWAQFHTPRNLAAVLAIEAAELQELMLWIFEAASFGYRHLIDRLESGDSPDPTLFRHPREGGPTSHLDRARTELRQAGAFLVARLSAEQIAQLTPLHERVLELLPEA